jgi:hypothetical protein
MKSVFTNNMLTKVSHQPSRTVCANYALKIRIRIYFSLLIDHCIQFGVRTLRMGRYHPAAAVSQAAQVRKSPQMLGLPRLRSRPAPSMHVLTICAFLAQTLRNRPADRVRRLAIPLILKTFQNGTPLAS